MINKLRPSSYSLRIMPVLSHAPFATSQMTSLQWSIKELKECRGYGICIWFLNWVRPPTSLFIFVLPPASHWHFHPTSHLPLPVSSFTILPIFSAKLSDSVTVFVRVLNGASHTFRCRKIPHPTRFFRHLPHPTPDFHQHPASSWSFYHSLPHPDRMSTSHIPDGFDVASHLPLLFFANIPPPRCTVPPPAYRPTDWQRWIIKDLSES